MANAVILDEIEVRYIVRGLGERLQTTSSPVIWRETAEKLTKLARHMDANAGLPPRPREAAE